MHYYRAQETLLRVWKPPQSSIVSISPPPLSYSDGRRIGGGAWAQIRRLTAVVQTQHCSVFKDQRSRCPIHPLAPLALAPIQVLRSRRVIFPSKLSPPPSFACCFVNRVLILVTSLFFVYLIQPIQMQSPTQLA
jgi:hypothetical protein